MAMEIGQGVASGLIVHKAAQHLDKLTQAGPSHEDTVVSLLKEIRNALSPKETKDNVEDIVTLQPAPFEYLIDEDWHGKPHLCIFFPAITSVSLFTEGAGLVVKNSVAGWMQVDLRGRLCSGDANNHPVIISYREDALGVAF